MVATIGTFNRVTSAHTTDHLDIRGWSVRVLQGNTGRSQIKQEKNMHTPSMPQPRRRAGRPVGSKNRKPASSPGYDRYGAEHRRLRKALAPQVASGIVKCASCQECIAPGEPWHLMHDDRPGYEGHYAGPGHATCNAADAQRKGDTKRGIGANGEKRRRVEDGRWMQQPLIEDLVEHPELYCDDRIAPAMRMFCPGTNDCGKCVTPRRLSL